uniref:Uncharacterized protein n=1 Tax=Anguilla anguilla TaxID=7936 RepID=A0A0E9RA96_ANGAN
MAWDSTPRILEGLRLHRSTTIRFCSFAIKRKCTCSFLLVYLFYLHCTLRGSLLVQKKSRGRSCQLLFKKLFFPNLCVLWTCKLN